MILNIIFFVTMYPIVFLLYFVFLNTYKNSRDDLFSVTMEEEWKKDPKVIGVSDKYRKEMRACLIVLLLIPLCSLLTKHFSLQFTIWIFWLLAAIFLLSVPYARANKRLRKWKSEHEPEAETETDRNWIGGLLYYNPKDKRTLVDKKVGVGTTINMATPAGKASAAFTILVCACIPVMCGWLIAEEFTPISLNMDNQTLYAKHLKVDYEIPVSEIENLSMITELPRWSKSVGTGTDTLEKGTFYIRNVGKCQVFLNPENKKFIRFTVDGTDYYMGSSDDAQTETVYKELMEEIQ